MAIPDRFLRDLTLKTPITSTDEYNNVTATSWADTTIRGRVDQQARNEDDSRGRQGEVSGWLLLTNDATVTALCRVVDGTDTFDVEGRPWPVYGRSGVDHYEATLSLVQG